MNLETIIEKIDNSYDKILKLYRSVPVTDLLEPTLPNGWAIKDMLAHIAAWEWRCAGLLSQARETDMPLRANPDVDALNQEIYQDRQAWHWEDVELDLRESHQALIEAIRDLPPERLNDTIIQETIAEETWQHYEEHLADLQQWFIR